MTAECFGGPWDGERLPIQGRVVTVVAVTRPMFFLQPTTQDERFGCYVLTARGYDWEAEE